MNDDFTPEEVEARFNATLLRMLNTKSYWHSNVVSKRKISRTPIATVEPVAVNPQESWKTRGRK